MKKILGLDLGTNSIGWARVEEAETLDEVSSIIKLGVRVNPLTVEEQSNFEKGKSITTNADRTLKRGMRRNLQRYKFRRKNLIEILEEYGIISDECILSENGNKTTFETYRLRAKAGSEKISLEQFARVLLMINKKRGYKSSRKAKGEDDGQLIDGMEVAKTLYDEKLTPGQFCLRLIEEGKKYIPDFYRSDLQLEFNKIWAKQMEFYPEILTDELKDSLCGKNEKQVWAICEAPFGLVGIKRGTKGEEQKKENVVWRVEALSQKTDLERLAIVLQKINAQINNSSGYLGAISDRSKELFFNKVKTADGYERVQTVGEYQMAILAKNPNVSFKNMVFYRQDYLDEFNVLWETQAKFHKELTDELKHKIRDVVIFYQRPLKSQKGLIGFCEFERKEIDVEIDGKKKTKTIGSRVIPRSSPLFQEFKIWQTLNNIEVFGKGNKSKKQKEPNLFEGKDVPIEPTTRRELYQEEKDLLARELSVREKMTKNEILKLLFDNWQELDLNFKEVQGNLTMAALFNAYKKIIELSGHDIVVEKKSAQEIIASVKEFFNAFDYNSDILYFDSEKEPDEQPMYKLWHLLYSFEGDNSNTGHKKLINKISNLYDFEREYATVLAKVTFQDDYGNLSAKAIRKILPHLKDGNKYDVACDYAGYRHSASSLTREELDKKTYKDRLDILPKNSLRNPVVEKILNQMVNVINEIIAVYGKPDEIRIELARELKKNAKERGKRTNAIAKTTKAEEYKKILSQPPFNLSYISRNDRIRYKLYDELKGNGYKTLYSDTYISPVALFSGDFDIEHIIPQARLFDDSFSNKTLELSSINKEKGSRTAHDFINEKYGETAQKKYLIKIEHLCKTGVISRTKYNKLKMQEKDIPDGFIDRDIRDTQYIAKYAKTMLEKLVKSVVSTTGSITDRLREDWQLIDVMKELNWDKYKNLGLTEEFTGKDGHRIRKIKDWTKRNDHRHHAMDALTVAFTKRAFVQYLNNLNARISKKCSCGYEKYGFDTDEYANWTCPNCGRKHFAKKDTNVIYGIEHNELYRNDKGKLLFNPPFALDEFRSEAKKHLENTLVSIKAKNKVTTKNINITAKRGGTNKTIQQTPRGRLHKETIFGSQKQDVVKEETVNAKFNEAKILTVTKPAYKEALLKRLRENGNDPKKAFSGKNSLEKNPVWLNTLHTQKVPEKVRTKSFETVYTIRKEVAPDLKIDKVIDTNIRRKLEERLNEFNGDAQKAFSKASLEENPIWLNKEKGISIKRVTISGISNAESLHDKRDKDGNLILDGEGNTQPVDFVNTSNNHHVAIYRDKDGNLQEKVVSFFEAVARANRGLPIIDKEYKQDDGWVFLFTMKQNEYFVFPNDKTGFNPKEIDLMNPENYGLISPNLFRVQKIATRNYMFRHHLETKVSFETKEVETLLRGIAWELYQSTEKLQYIVKVRVNHIGQIVSVGEY
ncbi:CRISPR RNA-guided endonuclease Cas9 [Fibrobacteres bacterium R8-0-B4]